MIDCLPFSMLSSLFTQYIESPGARHAMGTRKVLDGRCSDANFTPQCSSEPLGSPEAHISRDEESSEDDRPSNSAGSQIQCLGLGVWAEQTALLWAHRQYLRLSFGSLEIASGSKVVVTGACEIC